MPKERVPLPEETAAAVLFAADRTCCVCNQRGLSVQIHHIDEDPSHNEVGNLAVLCLQCHDGTQLKGGFGRKLDAAQVLQYREDWDRRVSRRRAEADRLAATTNTPPMVTPRQPTAEKSPLLGHPGVPPVTGLVEYVKTLPSIRALAYRAAEPGWGGATTEMVDASWSVVDVLVAALTRLARWYPYNHFGEDPRKYFAEVIAARAKWHHLQHSTAGVGWSGTIVGPMTASSVLGDVERMVVDMAGSLVGFGDGEFDYTAWGREWSEAAESSESNSSDA